MGNPNLYAAINKILDKLAVNGVLHHDKLTTLVSQFGNKLEELPLSVLNGRKFEVKPGVVVHFQNNAKNPLMLKDIHFNNNNVEFSYKDTHYSHMQFSSGTNQVIFEDNGIKLLDPNNHPIEMSGEGAFTEHHDL